MLRVRLGQGIALVAAGLIAGSACGQTPRDPAPVPLDSSSRQTRIPGEYLVTLAAEADVNAINGLYGRFGIKGIQVLAPNLFLLRLADDPGPAKMEELRGQNGQVEAIQPNYAYRTGRRNAQ